MEETGVNVPNDANAANTSLLNDRLERTVVNSSHDLNVTNVVSLNKELPRIQSVLDICRNILSQYSGPQAGYAMLVSNTSTAGFEPNVFTRDGIRILSAVEFMSPLEKYIKDMIAYVGGRVDSNAKDGTTSAMLFASVFLSELLKKRDIIAGFELSAMQIDAIVTRLFADIQKQLQKYTFDIRQWLGLPSDAELTDAEMSKAAGEIAFVQALSSSGGNIQLALAMKQIFENSPPSVWEYISYNNARVEDDRPFSVVIDEWDTTVRCVCNTPVIMNRALGTEYEDEDVEVLVYADQFAMGDQKAEDLQLFLRHYPKDKKLAVVVSGSTMLSQVIAMANRDRSPEYRISLWDYAPEVRSGGAGWPWELFVLSAKAGVTPMDRALDQLHKEESSTSKMASAEAVLSIPLIRAKKIWYRNQCLEFYGICPEQTDGTCVHPYAQDVENAPEWYRACYREVQHQLDMYKKALRDDPISRKYFSQIANDLACIHRPTLRIGGTTHEHVANLDVAEDVEGATMSSLNKGFVVNGIFGLSNALVLAAPAEDDDSNEADFCRIVLGCASEAVLTVLNTLYPDIDQDDLMNTSGSVFKKGMYTNILESKYFTAENVQQILSDDALEDGYVWHDINEYREDLSDFNTDTTEKDVRDRDMHITYPVLQPVAVTTELLRRVRELLIKFLGTKDIIVFGGVALNDSKSESTPQEDK